MAQQTAVEWLRKNLKDFPHIKHSQHFKDLIEQAKQMEKEQIIDAMLYALDEDGHTGEWKLNFVNNYYNQILNHKK